MARVEVAMEAPEGARTLGIQDVTTDVGKAPLAEVTAGRDLVGVDVEKGDCPPQEAPEHVLVSEPLEENSKLTIQDFTMDVDQMSLTAGRARKMDPAGVDVEKPRLVAEVQKLKCYLKLVSCLFFVSTVGIGFAFCMVSVRRAHVPAASSATEAPPNEVYAFVSETSNEIETPFPNHTFAKISGADIGDTVRVELALMFPGQATMTEDLDLAIQGKTIEGDSGRSLLFADSEFEDEWNESDFEGSLNESIGLYVYEFVDDSNSSTYVEILGVNVTSVSCEVLKRGELTKCQYHEVLGGYAERRLFAIDPVGWIVWLVKVWMDQDIPHTPQTRRRRTSRSSCFPGSAKVLTPEGSKFMRDVRVSDLVLTATGYSAVYMFGHYDPFVLTDFVRLTTSTGHALSVSPDHFMRFANGSFALASSVQMGDVVEVLDEAHGLIHANVTDLIESREVGLYNPYPHTGTMIVDGVLASAHSSWFLEGSMTVDTIQSVYQVILSPVRFLHNLFPGVLERFAEHTVGHGALSERGVSGILSAAVAAFFP